MASSSSAPSSSIPMPSEADISQAISLIQSAYDPAASADPATVQNVQSSLLSLQRTPFAWGLIVPLLAHPDPNVQFFGAHTAHAKISRGELSVLPESEQLALRDALVNLAGVQRTRVVRRKMYSALSALAIRLVPAKMWDGWVEGTVGSLVGMGAASEHVHEFLAGAAEDVGAANLLPQPRLSLDTSLRSASSLVIQSIASVVASHSSEDAVAAALACLVAWLPNKLLPDTDIASLIPSLIALLQHSNTSSTHAASALSELLSRPPTAWSPAVLLEPLLLRVLNVFPQYSPSGDSNLASLTTTAPSYALPSYAPPPALKTHTKLLVALAEAAVEWVAAHVVDVSACSAGPPRALLAQTFLRVMLALVTVDPGGARVRVDAGGGVGDGEGEDDGDDEEDEANAGASLGFWYLLQEALWEVPAANAYLFPSATPPSELDEDDPERFRRGSPWTPAPEIMVRSGSYQFGAPGGDDTEGSGGSAADEARMAHARAVYAALVRVLRVKVVWPGGVEGRDRMDRFALYRRDVGDTLVNAYYVLRDDLLVFLVGEAEAAAADAHKGGNAWEKLEAPLFLLRAVHEALDLDTTSASAAEKETAGSAALVRLFGDHVWGRLPPPAEGGEGAALVRLRRTALGLVETYAAYFTTRSPDAVLSPLGYVLGALKDPGVCLQAALALRSLCDANRRALAARIGAFAEVHAGMGGVPDSEKAKVLQSIASVIQALPPTEGIAPTEAMVMPILQRLGVALGAVATHPDAARATAILQLEILAGIARGLTRTTEAMGLDEDESGGPEAAAVRAAREDSRLQALRQALSRAVEQVAELWSADAAVGQALSELVRAITALPADVTLLSLPAGPLLGVVCSAARRRLTGVWLALAASLVGQLNPPPLLLGSPSGPSEEAEACVREAVGVLVGTVLGVLGVPNGMVENPDIVQEFFACMDRVAQDFTASFCALPDGAFDALVRCAISALALQERYSLVAACTFLGTLIHRLSLYAPISAQQVAPLQAHLIRTHGRAIMRAVLCGFAGAAPRSVTPNLLEILSALVTRWEESTVAAAEGDMRSENGGRASGGGARGWVSTILFADDFPATKASREDKERFVKTLVSSRSVKKIKEAANQFSTVAWGLEGSTFGYASV
ncbi:armadillo-type protein [Favolaschia claudopus]|uniref:Armadillo-type protein n=1 Tax=Favolaschia claudopus TaxID=2862362 RepID=A0AAW0DN67_9AGAR